MTAEDGTQGLGEAWSDPADPEAILSHLRRAAAELLAGTMAEPSSLLAAAAASAVDIALWDIRARQAGMPLHRLLGAIDARLPVYASGGLYADGTDVRALAAEMGRATASGFDTVKMKIAALPLADDMARVAAVRTAIGPRRTLIVDAVERLTRQAAPDWIQALRRYGVTYIQAPLPVDDLDGMAALPVTVIAGEREYRRAAFQALLDRGAVGLMQFNPGLAGGISGAMTLMGMAGRAGVPVTLQCYSTAILQAVCFQLSAGRVGVHSAEYHQFHDNLYEALPACMTTVEGGLLVLDDGAGLGIDPGLPDRIPAQGTIRPVFRLSA